MKRLLFIVLTGTAIALLAMVGAASANGGPHGGYTATTDACAGCHRVHTAAGPNLLVATTTYDLCTSCHGAAGSGANTNVDDGIYLSSRDNAATNGDVGAANTPDNSSLLAGGFVNYNGAGVTSTHDVVTGSATDAWGNGVARGTSAALTDGALDCASCHDPHGSSQYRIINDTLNGNAVSAALVDEGAAKDYDTEQWGAGMSTICAACHNDYHQTAAGQGSILDGTTYTHRIDMPYNFDGNVNPETVGVTEGPTTYRLPLAASGVAAPNGDLVVCSTCHLAHGTSASMTGLATGPNTGDSDLLRLDNRGVCEVCHQK